MKETSVEGIQAVLNCSKEMAAYLLGIAKKKLHFRESSTIEKAVSEVIEEQRLNKGYIIK